MCAEEEEEDGEGILSNLTAFFAASRHRPRKSSDCTVAFCVAISYLSHISLAYLDVSDLLHVSVKP